MESVEEGRYGMWAAKRKHSWRSDPLRHHHLSWEEQAFAEDTAGIMVWPPRSYSCTFCGREFRSAQALGGHMNVHRRDRARLQQSFNNHNQNPSYAHNNNNNDNNNDTCTIDSPAVTSPHHQPSSLLSHGKTRCACFTPGQLFHGRNDEADNMDVSVSPSGLFLFKKPRTLPLFLKPCFQEGMVMEAEVARGVNTGAKDDIDLELRLGDPQKVN